MCNNRFIYVNGTSPPRAWPVETMPMPTKAESRARAVTWGFLALLLLLFWSGILLLIF